MIFSVMPTSSQVVPKYCTQLITVVQKVRVRALLRSGSVGLDRVLRQLRARGVLAGRVADLGGAAAHQDDGLSARLLKAAQHHDLDQAADVQRRRRSVEPDIGGLHAFGEFFVETVEIAALVDEAAFG